MNVIKNFDLKRKKWKTVNETFVKMDKRIIAFGDTEIKKQKLYYHKNPTSIDDVGICKILISNKISYGKKGF